MDATAPRLTSNVVCLEPRSRERDPLTQHACESIQQQARAIAQVATRLDERFAQAAHLLYDTPGHVIITGLGKSGHIGRKLAATLASTGTPSFFVHAGEALHGDLGMVTERDSVMLISYSGETAEVVALLPFLKARGIRTLAMVGKLDSALGRSVDVALDVSVDREACPNNLAPTTSTLATMAMGDALAVCLTRMRDFRHDDFARLHPGGSVGRRATRVSQAIERDGLCIVGPETTLDDALVELALSRRPFVLVCSHDRLLGVVGAAEIRAAGKEARRRPVHESMNPRAPLISSQAYVDIAEERLQREGLDALVVTGDRGELLGIYMPRTH